MLSELEASPTPKLPDIQELSLHTVFILSPLFLILERTDPPGHSPWQTTCQPIMADHISITTFESTSTENSTTSIFLPFQYMRHTPARTCFILSCVFLIFSGHIGGHSS